MWEQKCRDCENLVKGIKDVREPDLVNACSLNRGIIYNINGRPNWCPLDFSREDQIHVSVNNYI